MAGYFKRKSLSGAICGRIGSMANSRARKNLGDSGERVAALELQQRGYAILARNFRTRRGEMDLIATDADGLTFIEVRTRRGSAAGAPEESLTPRKRARLLAVAQEFLQAHPEYAEHAWRIDLVAIELDRAGRIARLDVIKNAVEN
ncbi:MAG: YraN family protein [Chloroflexota bacterium]